MTTTAPHCQKTIFVSVTGHYRYCRLAPSYTARDGRVYCKRHSRRLIELAAESEAYRAARASAERDADRKN